VSVKKRSVVKLNFQHRASLLSNWLIGSKMKA